MPGSSFRAYGLRCVLVLLLCLVFHPAADAQKQDTWNLKAQVGRPFSQPVPHQGGYPPFSWKVVKGPLPRGLQLSGKGLLHGTPTQPSPTAVTFTVQVSDSWKPTPNVATVQVSIVVEPAPLRIPIPLPVPRKISGAAAPAAPAKAPKTSPKGSGGIKTGSSGSSALKQSPVAITKQQSSTTSKKSSSKKGVGTQASADNAGGNQNDGAVPGTATPGAYSLYTLGMAGVDVTSTSTSGPEQQAFVEYDLTAPVRFGWGKKSKKKPGMAPTSTGSGPIDSSWWVWFDPRIASVPTPKTAAISSLGSASSGLTATGVQTLGDITQTLEFRGGLEYALLKPKSGILFGHNPVADISMSFIAGFGAVTPFNSSTGSQEFDLGQPGSSGSGYNVTNVLGQLSGSPQLQKEYPQLYSALNTQCSTAPTTCPLEHVAFILPNRSRFYRSYFGGFRLKTFFFKDSNGSEACTHAVSCSPDNIFPGTFDFTVGQDATVTGGKLRGVVGTISVNYPLTRWPWLRVFGTAYLRFAKNQNSLALALPAAQSFVSLEDPSVILQPIQPRDQDYFRLGFGIDLVQVVKAMAKRWSSQPALLSKTSLDFSQGAKSSPQTLTLTNMGSATLTRIKITASPSNFNARGNGTNCGSSLDPGNPCTIAVTFTPPSKWSSGQVLSGVLIVKTNAGQSVVPLSAEAPK